MLVSMKMPCRCCSLQKYDAALIMHWPMIGTPSPWQQSLMLSGLFVLCSSLWWSHVQQDYVLCCAWLTLPNRQRDRFVRVCNLGNFLWITACHLTLFLFALWAPLAVSWLQHWWAVLPPGYGSSHSGVTTELNRFNCLRSAAVGKAARLSIYWQDAACRMVIH